MWNALLSNHGKVFSVCEEHMLFSLEKAKSSVFTFRKYQHVCLFGRKLLTRLN